MSFLSAIFNILALLFFLAILSIISLPKFFPVLLVGFGIITLARRQFAVKPLLANLGITFMAWYVFLVSLAVILAFS